MIHFTVFTIPVPQPRQRHRVIHTHSGRVFAHNYTPTRDPVNAFKAALQAAWIANFSEALLDGPLAVTIDFVLPRPAKYMTRKYSGGRMPHDGSKDIDNLYKAVADALNGVAWRDDKQICDLRARKFYAEKDGRPRVEIGVDTVA